MADPLGDSRPARINEGYLHPRYAASLSEFGQPRHLPRSGAWLLVRPIPGAGRHDALAGYRNLFCLDWSSLGADLDACRDLVSVTGVTDPFAAAAAADLRRGFPDLMRPYKENCVIDLRDPNPSRHHRAEVRRGRRSVQVSVEHDPTAFLDEWEELYECLRRRYAITGIKAFSKASFAEQLATPGCVAVRALASGRSVAMTVWYVMGDVAHYHLAASNTSGYRTSASYALMQAAIDTFAGMGLRWMNLGATAGVEADEADGLTRFKRGWTDHTRPSYLCGRIFDREEYARLTVLKSASADGIDYFPAYRTGEYG